MVGQVRTIYVDNEPHDVEVIGAMDSPSWWRCVDLQTGTTFMASDRWVIGLEEKITLERPSVNPWKITLKSPHFHSKSRLL
jgi:hypothetical protein